MKIAIISSGFFPVIDGVTVTLFHRLRYLSQYGHQVLLFCPDYSSLGSIYPDWQKYTGEIFPNVRIINLHSTPVMGLEFEQNVSQKSYSVVLQELHLFQPDIIHVDEPERLWLGFLKRAGLDFSRQAKIPCISFFHTNFIEYLEDYLPLPQWGLKILQFLAKYHRNWIYNGYDLTLISSKMTAHKVTSLGFKNVVIADLLGVDIEPYKNLVKESNYFATKYNIKDINQKLKLVFLGRLTPDKGWHFTLDALTRFSSQINFDNLAFIIAGEGTMKAEIQQKIRNLTSHIYLLDRILPEHIPPLLINSDIYFTNSEKETKGLNI
jgi:glycosyltransferase involved in cell wall biosynthesis